jgi:hypothetical protein
MPHSVALTSEGYFTSASTKGRVHSGEFPFAIGVLESPGNRMPTGMAFGSGQTDTEREVISSEFQIYSPRSRLKVECPGSAASTSQTQVCR